MKLITPPLKQNVQGTEVKNLHYILFFITQKLNDPNINEFFNNTDFQKAYKPEVSRQLYGKATLKFVNFLQEHFNLQQFEVGVVDRPTAEMLNRLLDQFNGLVLEKPEGYPFEVSELDQVVKFSIMGFVENKNQERIKDQAVMAFDVDLRGAAIYRTANTIKEIKDNAGFSSTSPLN